MRGPGRLGAWQHGVVGDHGADAGSAGALEPLGELLTGLGCTKHGRDLLDTLLVGRKDDAQIAMLGFVVLGLNLAFDAASFGPGATVVALYREADLLHFAAVEVAQNQALLTSQLEAIEVGHVFDQFVV